jgi:hypothetical protein
MPGTSPTSPTQVGPYRLDREIARGGMGVVSLAHDTRLPGAGDAGLPARPRRHTVKPPIVTFPDLQKYRFVMDLGDALPDGRVLLIQRGDDEDDINRFDVVFNFFDLLKEKMHK